jgi:hypothetical protein
MTVTHRKRQHQPDEIQSTSPPSSFPLAYLFKISHNPGYIFSLRNHFLKLAVNEPGLQIHCDACGCDLTHSIRIKCADTVCEPGDGVDICPACFCAGKEFGKHKRGHRYRVVVSHTLYSNILRKLRLLFLGRNFILTRFFPRTGAQTSKPILLFTVNQCSLIYPTESSCSSKGYHYKATEIGMQ